MESESDPVGRWSYQTLRSFEDRRITIITAYRVCQNQQTGPLTASEQQRTHLILQCNDLSPHPRQTMLSSLTTFIKSIICKQHEILLMWDANSILSDPEILLFMHQYSLFDLHVSNDFPPAANTSSKGHQIDFIFGTYLLRSSVGKEGILSFQHSPFSDHRAIYVDLDEATLFQDFSTDPTAPTQCHLHRRNPSQCAKYLLLVKGYLTYHNVFPRLVNLTNMVSAKFPLVELIAAYESLDCDITAAELTAEKRTSKSNYGYPWSPTLMALGQDFKFWKCRCSD